MLSPARRYRPRSRVDACEAQRVRVGGQIVTAPPKSSLVCASADIAGASPIITRAVRSCFQRLSRPDLARNAGAQMERGKTKGSGHHKAARLHDLRHYATRLMLEGINPRVFAVW